MSTRVLLSAGVAATLALCACGGSSGTSHSAKQSAAVSAAAASTRWWTDPNGAAGSTIDVANPTAAAKGLKPSRPDYCTILKQTVAAGHDLFGAGANPPSLIAVRAWLAELEAVAPPAVLAAWQTTGSAVTAIVAGKGSAGKSVLPAGLSAAGLASAAQVISTDARSNCGLSLAK